ncbi:protein WVD2-like 1 [Silene latifolia]|uniref:protein WVD2-like 1 n=1 Tax=Silene latifolia TaxID=37657 RepID=UPI003D780BE2
MGTDVADVGGEPNKSPYAKVRAKVSVNPDQEVDPKLHEENKEVKDFEVKECTSEAPRAENSPEKSSSAGKLSSGEVLAENTKLKIAEQTPSDVTIDKQVCGIPRPVETPDLPTESSSKSPYSTKKSLLSTPHVTRKHLDDEDNWSMTSSASVRTTRSRTTVPVAPTFSISDRLEKRKEYYAKLEEKRKALEAEKREYEARTKEEEAAALKQMRKNMKVKANPVPSFYYEKPPPKRELKKLATTRAVSPKFGRRKSCSDALRSFSEEKRSVRAPRHSLGGHLYKEGSTPSSTPTRKERSKQNIAVKS